MKRVLVVSPHFPPVSAADMHRVRMLLPFLERNGWQAEVLAVSPDQVLGPRDSWLLDGVPPEIPVHRADALSSRIGCIPGLGTLGLRALPGLSRAGDVILAARRFDLVYFSTTMFEVHVLGPRWKRKFGVPFVMDYQDAWVSDYYKDNPGVPVPGGRLKYAVVRRLHQWMEPHVLAKCSGITSVSPEYPRQLERRYPSMPHLPVLVQGFPGAPRDFERALPIPAGDAPYDPTDGYLHWVYVGRGGSDMAKALSAIFRALRDHASDGLKKRLKLHFIGTSYAAAGTGHPTIAPIAAQFGLECMVDESTDRIDYARALWCLRNADALIVPGSDDPAYTASKIYPYLLAGRPMLAVFHASSTVADLIAEVGGAVFVPFASDETEAAIAPRIATAWLDARAFENLVPLDSQAFLPFTDAGCAAEMAAYFDQCIATEPRKRA